MKIHRRLRLLRRDESGAALVEFALVAPVLLLLLLGMVDFGRAYNYWIDSTHLVHTGARWAAVNKNPGPGATLQESIRERVRRIRERHGLASAPMEYQPELWAGGEQLELALDL